MPVTIGDWADHLVQELGGTPNATSRDLLTAQAFVENTSAHCNPLATTQHNHGDGSTVFNSAGVRNFPDCVTGLALTAETFRNGHYPTLLHALTDGDASGIVWAEYNVWGTGAVAVEASLGRVRNDPNMHNVVLPSLTDATLGTIATPTPMEVPLYLARRSDGQTVSLVTNGDVIPMHDPPTLERTQADLKAAGFNPNVVVFTMVDGHSPGRFLPK